MNWTSAIYSLILPSGSIIFAWAIFQPSQSPTQPLLPNRSSTRIAWKNKYEYTCRNEWKYGWWGEQESWKDERTVHPILEYYPSYLSTSNKNGRSILSITKFLLLNNQTIISGNDGENTKKKTGGRKQGEQRQAAHWAKSEMPISVRCGDTITTMYRIAVKENEKKIVDLNPLAKQGCHAATMKANRTHDKSCLTNFVQFGPIPGDGYL